MIYKGLRAVKQQYKYKQTHRKDPALFIYDPKTLYKKSWTDSKLLFPWTAQRFSLLAFHCVLSVDQPFCES